MELPQGESKRRRLFEATTCPVEIDSDAHNLQSTTKFEQVGNSPMIVLGSLTGRTRQNIPTSVCCIAYPVLLLCCRRATDHGRVLFPHFWQKDTHIFCSRLPGMTAPLPAPRQSEDKSTRRGYTHLSRCQLCGEIIKYRSAVQ